jgi:2-succinyl-6-hydroxy-2,4-cyclohexadiene-1-carboxylate synthase
MFERLASEVGEGIAAPDLPGHGRTTIEPVSTRTAVDAVAGFLSDFASPPLLLGYSQGGRTALQIALTHPELIGSLVLVAISPGLSERARQMRRAADSGLAARIERIGTERFIDEWLANPLVTTRHLDERQREKDLAMRLENTATGLAAALREMGQASVSDSRKRIDGLPMPVKFVAGTRDPTYSELATEMAALRGDQPILVDDAGHNVVLEAPGAIAAVISGLLQNG